MLLTCSCLRSIADSSVSFLQHSISSLQKKINEIIEVMFLDSLQNIINVIVSPRVNYDLTNLS